MMTNALLSWFLLALVKSEVWRTVEGTILREPTQLWATAALSSQPTDAHYSKTEDRLYVFGHNPATILSLDPQDGYIFDQFEIPDESDTTSLSILKSVVVYESASRMDYAILSFAAQNSDIRQSRIVCWDFYLQLPRWQMDVDGLGLTLPNYGKASFSDDGSLIYQHFKDGEIYCLKSSSGQIVWSKTFFPMAGWTYLNGDLYGGILAEQGGFGISPGIYHLDASTGSYVDRWRAPHQCFASGQTSFLAPGQQDNTAPSNTAATEVPNCNNIWTNSVAYGDYLYFMDDYFGLMKLDAFDISSGPEWTNAFAQNAPQGSQQTFYPPIVSRDGSIVYASALHSTAAVLAETGETLWVVSQDNQWITRTMLLGGNDELYLPYNFSIHKIVDGETEWRTDSTLLNTFMTLDPSGSTVFAAGVTVQAYRVDLPPLTVPEETLEQNSTASTTTSLGDTSSCPIRRLDFLATLLSLVYVTLC